MRTAKILIRLRWSDSSLRAHAILWEMLWWLISHFRPWRRYLSSFVNIKIMLRENSDIKISHNGRKRTIGHLRPAKIQISLRVRAVWSESSPGAFWIAQDAYFLHADNEDSNQTARMRRLIWVFAGRTCKKVRFLTLRFILWKTMKHVWNFNLYS